VVISVPFLLLDNRFLRPEPTAFETGQGQHRQIYSARYSTDEQVSFEKPTAQGLPLLKTGQSHSFSKAFRQFKGFWF
jgi:hypothetical protein